jgi:hypothetical protein
MFDPVMPLELMSGEPGVASGDDRLVIDHATLSQTMDCNATRLVSEY